MATIEEALALWEDVPPSAKASTAATWLGKAVTLVMTRRVRSRDLALAYYRLVRALHTGTTIADPRKKEPKSVTLDQLRREFATLAQPEKPAEEPSEAPSSNDTRESQEDESEASAREDGPSEDDEADRILVEELAQLDALERAVERAAEEEAREVLETLGPANQERMIRQIGDDRPASEVDALRDEANLRAGTRQAAAAARVAMNGGRSTLWTAMSRDKRAIGYVRLSRTGTPCGWCAMLISRGPVYRSESSAEYSDGDKYHDNCNCYAMPVFTREQYDSSDLFGLNRKYAEEWPRVTRGLSGKAALSAWRYFIRQEQKSTRAQAARSTTTSRRRENQ